MKVHEHEKLIEMVSKKFSEHPSIYMPKVHLHMCAMKEFREKTEIFINRLERKEDDMEARGASAKDV